MPAFIRNPKDFWSGVIFFAVGIAAVTHARAYPFGTTFKMGPGYFPTVLGALLALVGLLAMVRGSWRPGEPVGRFAHRHIFLILVSTVLFGVLIRGAGLVAAAAVLVMVSAYASRRFRLGPSALLATGMAAFCALLFVKALGLPIPLLGAWLGG